MCCQIGEFKHQHNIPLALQAGHVTGPQQIHNAFVIPIIAWQHVQYLGC
jgi:hypothetical protein